MILKIKFVYSSIYDRRYRESPRIQKILKDKDKSYPSIKKITNYVKSIEELWKKQDNKILREIEKVTGLKWKEKEIKCYVIGFGRCFSDPLTMKLFENKNDFIDILTHELIHQIQFQNSKKTREWFKLYLKNNYKKESHSTKSHISVHAIHKKIFLNLFNKKRFERQINFHKKFPDYKKAWEIVEKEGYENIIKKFKELTK